MHGWHGTAAMAFVLLLLHHVDKRQSLGSLQVPFLAAFLCVIVPWQQQYWYVQLLLWLAMMSTCVSTMPGLAYEVAWLGHEKFFNLLHREPLCWAE